jgi:hypothetical protein
MWRSEANMRGLASIAAIMLAFAVPAAAQDEADKTAKRPTVVHNAPPSPNATINLINLLVKQGVLGEEQAAALIKQADDEAYVARQAVRDAATKADGAEKRAATAADAVSPPGTKRVTYVPEIVKQQIRDDIKNEVMAKAEKENWASPGKYPEWAQRIRFFGDVRVRYEADLFPPGNNPLTAVNYNAINTGTGYNVLGTGPNANPFFWPTFDTNQNRSRPQLAAHLGMEANLFDGFWAGFRIGTGDSSTPVSFNHFEGGAGGNFSKAAIWLDRAFIKYSPISNLNVYAGRFDNPFFTATDLMYYRDLAFDGFAAQANYEVRPGITPFVVGGAFPIFNTAIDSGSTLDFNSPNAIPGKAPSNDKWMFGGQLGTNIHVVPEVDFTFGAAYYDFTNVQGSLSTPCITVGPTDFCSTDLNRPTFAQKGNTYMALRNIVPSVDGSNNLLPQFQYFGLASAFRDVVASARLDLGHFDPVHIILDGEYVRNVAWNQADIAAKVLANPIPAGPTAGCVNLTGCQQVYAGGNQGWLARLTVGDRQLVKLWDWNAFVGYKFLESDAVIDAFTDSEFGLGGTNLKGYFIGGRVAVGQNVWLSAKWMSANQVAGAPYAVDIFLLDLNARF